MRPDLHADWQAVQGHLETCVPRSTYHHWLEPMAPVGSRGSLLYLAAPSATRAWVERRYAELIQHSMAAVGCRFTEIAILTSSDQPPDDRPADDPTGLTLNPSYTFDTFVIGDGNRIAHAAALAVAERPGQAYNPLFLYGPPGLGKTHLMGAVSSYLAAHAPTVSVHYTTAEAFTNEFLGALHGGGADRFKNRVRGVDVLLIDDVQFLENKPRTEEEFFHTFNALHEAGSQLILSADRSPQDLSDLAQRLRDRFEWGLIAPLGAPDLTTRTTVLRKLGQLRGVALDKETEAVIAGRVTDNLRRLEGALTRLLAYASLTGRDLDANLAAEIVPAEQPPADTTDELVTRITELTGRRMEVDPEALRGRARSARITLARHIAIYLTRELTDLSLPGIGGAFGGRDHSTVLSAIRKVEARRQEDPETSSLIDDLRVEAGG
ncbi:MAG: chromosomal replication initiator protein DnaA [Solirubrobacterales bacterium]